MLPWRILPILPRRIKQGGGSENCQKDRNKSEKGGVVSPKMTGPRRTTPCAGPVRRTETALTGKMQDLLPFKKSELSTQQEQDSLLEKERSGRENTKLERAKNLERILVKAFVRSGKALWKIQTANQYEIFCRLWSYLGSGNSFHLRTVFLWSKWVRHHFSTDYGSTTLTFIF